MTTVTKTIDENTLQAFMEKMVGDLGAATSSVLVLIGRRLGLYKALAETPFNLVLEARR